MKRSAQSFSFHLLLAKYFVFVRNGVREEAPVWSALWRPWRYTGIGAGGGAGARILYEAGARDEFR